MPVMEVAVRNRLLALVAALPIVVALLLPFAAPLWGQVVITTPRLTITGGTPPPPPLPFPPVTVTTPLLTITGGAPPPPRPPFPGVTVTTPTLTISGRATP